MLMWANAIVSNCPAWHPAKCQKRFASRQKRIDPNSAPVSCSGTKCFNASPGYEWQFSHHSLSGRYLKKEKKEGGKEDIIYRPRVYFHMKEKRLFKKGMHKSGQVTLLIASVRFNNNCYTLAHFFITFMHALSFIRMQNDTFVTLKNFLKVARSVAVNFSWTW